MSQARIPLIINGIDFSEAMNRTGYSLEYEERSGNNAFLSLAGTYDYDILALVPVINWPMNALWLYELDRVRSAALSSTFVPVYYRDLAGSIRFGYFHATFGRFETPLVTNYGIMIKDGTVLTLRGR